MLFCLKSRLSGLYLDKADEIKIESRDWESTPDIIENYPDKKIVLEIFSNEEVDWDKIKTWNILAQGRLTLCLDRVSNFGIAKEFGIPFYLGYPVGTPYEISALILAGVSEIVVGSPVFFNTEYLKSVSIKKRCYPNVSHLDGFERENGINGQWIRPEDISLYEGAIDVMEFIFVTPTKEQALFRIYAEEGHWPGEVDDIIENFNFRPALNRLVDSEAIEARLNCNQKCAGLGGTCQVCFRIIELSSPDLISEYAKTLGVDPSEEKRE